MLRRHRAEHTLFGRKSQLARKELRLAEDLASALVPGNGLTLTARRVESDVTRSGSTGASSSPPNAPGTTPCSMARTSSRFPDARGAVPSCKVTWLELSVLSAAVPRLGGKVTEDPASSAPSRAAAK